MTFFLHIKIKSQRNSWEYYNGHQHFLRQLSKEPQQNLPLLQKTQSTQGKSIYVWDHNGKICCRFDYFSRWKSKSQSASGVRSTHSRYLIDEDSQQKIMSCLSWFTKSAINSFCHESLEKEMENFESHCVFPHRVWRQFSINSSLPNSVRLFDP